MPIYFITGNKNKFREVSAIIPGIKRLDIDLPEIQETNPKRIIKAKLQEAIKCRQGEFIIEDVSFCMNGLNGLPGPLIKWFLKTMGVNGIFKLARALNNTEAEVSVIYGHADKSRKIHYFRGAVLGNIVPPRVKSSFGFDNIFMPKGHKRTFAEMSLAEKNKISMRRIALNKLKKHLKNFI